MDIKKIYIFLIVISPLFDLFLWGKPRENYGAKSFCFAVLGTLIFLFAMGILSIEF